jgi:hypothetical protein
MRRMAVLFGFLIVAALIAAVTFHVALAQNQVELDRLENRIDKEQRTYDQLMDDVAQSSAPEHVRTRALELGLVEPDPEDLSWVAAPPAEVPPAPDSPPNSLASWEEVKDQIAGAP